MGLTANCKASGFSFSKAQFDIDDFRFDKHFHHPLELQADQSSIDADAGPVERKLRVSNTIEMSSAWRGSESLRELDLAHVERALQAVLGHTQRAGSESFATGWTIGPNIVVLIRRLNNVLLISSGEFCEIRFSDSKAQTGLGAVENFTDSHAGCKPVKMTDSSRARKNGLRLVFVDDRDELFGVDKEVSSKPARSLRAGFTLSTDGESSDSTRRGIRHINCSVTSDRRWLERADDGKFIRPIGGRFRDAEQ